MLFPHPPRRPALGKASCPIAGALAPGLGQGPPVGHQPGPCDNGPECSLHDRLHELGSETCYCDTHSPGQKGGVENAIGRVRRTLPRTTALAPLPEEPGAQRIPASTNPPRKGMEYRPPAER